MTFQPGETIVIQEVWRGRLWSARPVVVVEESPSRLVHWCPRGVTWKVATTPPHRPRATTRAERFAENMLREDWLLGDFMWQVPSLEFVALNEWFGVRISWRPQGDHLGWYVNLQEPLRRWANGFRTMDMMLDLVVDTDRQWVWKDEDELAFLVDRGLISTQMETEVRVGGKIALQRLACRDDPFSDEWLKWTPDPTWGIPELPGDWAQLT